LKRENKPTVAINDVVLVAPPVAVPVTTMLYRPTFVWEEVVIVRVLENCGVPDVGLKEHEIVPEVPLVHARLTA